MDILVEYTRGLLRAIFWFLKKTFDFHRAALVEIQAFRSGLENGSFVLFAVGIMLPFSRLILLVYFEELGYGGIPWYAHFALAWVAFMAPTVLFLVFRTIIQVVWATYFFAYPEKRQKAKNEENPKNRLELSDYGETEEDIEALLYSNGDIAQTNHK